MITLGVSFPIVLKRFIITLKYIQLLCRGKQGIDGYGRENDSTTCTKMNKHINILIYVSSALVSWKKH